jgi:hypothetical protein
VRCHDALNDNADIAICCVQSFSIAAVDSVVSIPTMRHSASSNHITLAAVQELQNTDPETLSSWILDQEHLKAPDARGSLTQLLTAIAVGCKFVASAVRKASSNDQCILSISDRIVLY